MLVDPGTVIQGIEPSPNPNIVIVPDVCGMLGGDALQLMEQVGLNFEYDESRNEEPLTGSEPAAGEEVEPGTTVEGVFGNNPSPEGVVVPDLAGMSGSDASVALGNIGLYLDYDTNDPNLALVGTEPAAGETVEAGTTVEALYN